MQLDSSVIYSNLLLFIFNLLPIYPLDGGRIIRNILKVKKGYRKAEIITNQLSNIVLIILSFLASIAIYYYQNIAIFLGIVVLWIMVLYENKRFYTYNKIYKIIDKEENYRYNEYVKK